MYKWKGLLVGIFLIGGVAAAEWEKGAYNYNDFSLPYQLYTPSGEIEESLPLVVVLHGSYEAGTDNEHHMLKGSNIGPDYFARKKIQDIQKAYILAPQTPVDIRWASTEIAPYDFDNTPITVSMEALLKLINELKIKDQIDSSRIYLIGLSRGGQGVWNAAMHSPDLFAAIVPISGSASPKHGHLLKDQYIWAFHGDKDEITNVEYTRDMVDAILKQGGSTSKIRYTEIEGGDHADSWLTAYSGTDIWHWMLKHQKNSNKEI